MVRNIHEEIHSYYYLLWTLGVKVRNMKIDFNIYGTWHRAMNTNDENL